MPNSNISSKIIDLAQDKMLKIDPADRLTMNEVCKHFDSVVADAEVRLVSSVSCEGPGSIASNVGLRSRSGRTELNRASGTTSYYSTKTSVTESQYEQTIPPTLTQPQSPLPHQVTRPPPTALETRVPIFQQSPDPRSAQQNPPTDFWRFLKDNDSIRVKDLVTQNKELAKFANKNGCTPVMLAAQNNNMELMRFLLPYSVIEQRDDEGKTVLHHALYVLDHKGENEDSLELLREIVSYGRQAQQAQPDIVNLLDRSNRSPLYICVDLKILMAAEALLNEGAWINRPPNFRGRDVFVKAVSSENDAMVRLLLKNGAEFERKDLPRPKDIPKSILDQLDEKNPRKKFRVMSSGKGNRETPKFFKRGPKGQK